MDVNLGDLSLFGDDLAGSSVLGATPHVQRRGDALAGQVWHLRTDIGEHEFSGWVSGGATESATVEGGVGMAGAVRARLGVAVGLFRFNLRAEGVWRSVCDGDVGAQHDGKRPEAEGRVREEGGERSGVRPQLLCAA